LNNIITKSLWRVLDTRLIETDPDVDVIAVTVEGDGKVYTAVVSGHKGMNSNEFITALRAATAGLLQAVGADMSVVGAQEGNSEDKTFDTGTQRAN